ncbi:hypothetical protein NDU88_001552 [Pleurodeles waltl]|uniref:Uncharacterized protein n=1 Tax=Pleurodeles waltl TaxID=8319 RepID=A0AAV7U9P0_PLEWA|nr:hypothetical protein NDU88_001552 [Pleurodeles waltl]
MTGALVSAAREPPDADDGTYYAQGAPGRVLIVLCGARQRGIALHHLLSSTSVGGRVPLFPSAEPPLVDRTNTDQKALLNQSPIRTTTQIYKSMPAPV